MIDSDKYYWHGYLDEYERLVFSQLKNPACIVEIGVGNSGSITYLTERFPTAKVHGVDIVSEQPNWYKSDRVKYHQLNQSAKWLMQLFLSELGDMIDLFIEDGSHTPSDQAYTLIQGIHWVRSGGFYILEDIHTSYFERHVKVNSFHVLLTLQHLFVSNLELTEEIMTPLATNSYFTETELEYLFTNIKSINLFKRTSLPLLCYNCRKNNFDYVKLLCKNCGINLYQEADSMSFIIKKL